MTKNITKQILDKRLQEVTSQLVKSSGRFDTMNNPIWIFLQIFTSNLKRSESPTAKANGDPHICKKSILRAT